MSVSLLQAQETSPEVLTFEEYMAFVKKYHPVARQAELQISEGEANLLKARGGFDPKIEVDYSRKEFKGTEYYDILNSTFKIPTWYGLEIKAGFEQNEGYYLNPERTVPEEGLFSAGVSLNLGQGLFADERMTAIRSARAFREQTLAERDLVLNKVLFDAAVAYFDWMQAYNEFEIYEGFLENAAERFIGVKQNAQIGEVPAIDTVEAKISLQDRTLQLEQAGVRLMKERLDLSNFLWMENNVPVELQPEIVPEKSIVGEVNPILGVREELMSDFSFENHPKIRSLRAKLRALELDRRLKANNLLPEINIDYNFITPEPDAYNTIHTSNYKAGLSLSFPLFLRKQRGELQLAELKVQDLNFDLELNERQIENKIEAVLNELESYKNQIVLIEEIVENYRTLLAAELRKFSFGESSLFLINSRESKLIEARLKQNEVLTKFLYAKAGFFRSLGAIPEVD
ncbi:transporter [Salinimicrobium marinum]|uniref:Transporter n=2 Tax=Salinimicrobium marinum TaxID=680283 RepID=A0A918SAA7_9FLAO|nr:transporter [Salinimicrobium marinum]